MKIYVIVLNWNGKKDTLTCLESLSEVSTPHQVIVVDNGSTDGSVEAIQQAYPSLILIETGENLGYAEGNNVGIRKALEKGADRLLILNNDTIVTRDILTHFLKGTALIQGGKALLMDEPFKIDHLGGIWNEAEGIFDLVGAEAPSTDWNDPIPLDYVCGVALFVHAEVFKRVGLFDPRFFLFWEEADWCFRAKKLGIESRVCPKAILFHKKSASFKGKPHTTYFWWRNRLLWISKNCSKKERKALMKRLFSTYLLLLKRWLIKSLQLPFAKKRAGRSLRYRCLRASLRGMHDFYFSRFGNGPKWLAKSK